MRIWTLFGAALLIAALAAACGGGDGGGDAGADADSDTDSDADTDADGGGTEAAIEIVGNWDGAQPAGVTLKTAVFACPFTMPPTYSDLDGTVDPDTGDVQGLVEGVAPGAWCVMSYIDMDPDDGLAPVEGTDALNATGDENENGAIAIDVVAGETTTLDLVFAI